MHQANKRHISPHFHPFRKGSENMKPLPELGRTAISIIIRPMSPFIDILLGGKMAFCSMLQTQSVKTSQDAKKINIAYCNDLQFVNK